MSQFINHKDDGTFVMYHTHPWLSGTPEFEHQATLNVSDLKHTKYQDGTDCEDELIVESACPICGAVAVVTLNNSEECQRLHAKFKAYKESKPYVEQAVAETMEKVKARGGDPKLDPKKG